MKINFKDLLQKIQQSVPPTSLSLIPGDYFFCRSFPLPPDLSETEIESFAELTIEGASPFHLDQLYWGFLTYPHTKHILIYAAPRERMKESLESQRPRPLHIFPSFIAQYGLKFSKPTITCIYSAGSISALYFRANESLAWKVVSRNEQLLATTTNLPAEDASLHDIATFAFDARTALIKEIDVENYAIDDTVRIVKPTPLVGNSKLTIEVIRISEALLRNAELIRSELLNLPFTSETAWAADIRPLTFKTNAQRENHKGHLLWRYLQASGVVLALLFVLQISSLIFNAWVNSQYKRIDLQQPEAQSIENRQELLNNLENFVQKELRPFSMLEVINQRRPNNLFFNRLNSIESNGIQLDGQSGNAQEMNQFFEALKSDTNVSSLEILRSNAKTGNTTFTISVFFNELARLDKVPEPNREASIP
jgi:hypothetical protein